MEQLGRRGEGCASVRAVQLTLQPYVERGAAAQREQKQAFADWLANASQSDLAAENRWRKARRARIPRAMKPLRRTSAPKRPLTSYIKFASEQRKEATSRGEPTTPVTEFAKTVGARWRELSPEQKQSYA